MPASTADPSTILAQLAVEAGLERLLESDPELLERALRTARGHAERLARPEAPIEEPAHVYLLRPRR